MAKNVSKATLSSGIADQIAAANAAEDQVDAVVTEVAEVAEAPNVKPASAPIPQVTIRANKPLPQSTRGKFASLPFDALEVGQSFFVPGMATTSGHSLATAMNKKHAPKRFSAAKDMEDGVEGMGFWRVA